VNERIYIQCTCGRSSKELSTFHQNSYVAKVEGKDIRHSGSRRPAISLSVHHEDLQILEEPPIM
jgi:hypothetical protein